MANPRTGIVVPGDPGSQERRIGGERLPLLPGLTVEAGTPVTALVRERDGRRQVVKLAPNTVPRFHAKVG